RRKRAWPNAHTIKAQCNGLTNGTALAKHCPHPAEGDMRVVNTGAGVDPMRKLRRGVEVDTGAFPLPIALSCDGERVRVRGSNELDTVHKDSIHMRGAQPWRTNRARVLRSPLTPAEDRMWSALRNRRLNGLKFVRQCPIGP